MFSFDVVLSQTHAWMVKQVSEAVFCGVFIMNFLKVCFSLCHSFRSTVQCERVKGLTRYFQVIHQGSWRQQDVDHAFMNAIIEPRLGIIEPLMGRVEAHLGIIKSLLGKIELCFGTVEPVKGLKKLYFENGSLRARKSAVN